MLMHLNGRPSFQGAHPPAKGDPVYELPWCGHRIFYSVDYLEYRVHFCKSWGGPRAVCRSASRNNGRFVYKMATQGLGIPASGLIWVESVLHVGKQW
jgi:hypothetical protein